MAGTVRVWSCQTWELLAQGLGHGDNVNSVSFFGDSKQLVSGARDGNIYVWDLEGVERMSST